MGDSTSPGSSAATLERWAVAYHEVRRELPGHGLGGGPHRRRPQVVPAWACPGPRHLVANNPAIYPVQMAADARQLGIPASAIPALPAQPTAEQLRAARERLEGMVASFLSAGL